MDLVGGRIIEGQLTKDERRIVREMICYATPHCCVECGTWAGGGSTRAIVDGLMLVKQGQLHSFELDADRAAQASAAYEREMPSLPDDLLNIYHMDYLTGMIEIMDAVADHPIDFAFLDGPERSEFTISALRHTVDRMPNGGHVMLHDWHTGKCDGVRAILPRLPGVELAEVYEAGPTGMALLEVHR